MTNKNHLALRITVLLLHVLFDFGNKLENEREGFLVCSDRVRTFVVEVVEFLRTLTVTETDEIFLDHLPGKIHRVVGHTQIYVEEQLPLGTPLQSGILYK